MASTQRPTATSKPSPSKQPGASAVKHPAHYNKGIECWDFTTSHDMDFLAGNVVKYITRWNAAKGGAVAAGQNGAPVDLLKAREYLNKLIAAHTPQRDEVEE